MTLDVIPGCYAVCRLEAAAAIPPWASGGALSSITRTTQELSIVCDAEAVPSEVRAARGYRALAVRGPLDFALVGIVASLSAALAAGGVSLFVVSTYDTDYVLVKGDDLGRAIAALEGAGHRVVTGGGASSPPRS